MRRDDSSRSTHPAGLDPSRRRPLALPFAAAVAAALVAVAIFGVGFDVTAGGFDGATAAGFDDAETGADDAETGVDDAETGVDDAETGTDDAETGTDDADNERSFVVADAESGEPLLELPVEDGSELTLAYTHSVEKTPVEERYVVNGTDLENDRIVFDSFGAGLPADADVTWTDEGLVASVDRTYERLYVAPGSIAGHELLVGEHRYDLVDLADGERVVLFVKDGSPANEANATDRPRPPQHT